MNTVQTFVLRGVLAAFATHALHTHAATHAPDDATHEAASQASTQPPADAPPVSPTPEKPMDPASMKGMDMSMQGGRAPSDARDPDYSENQAMSMLPGMADSMRDDKRFGKVLIDQFEFVDGIDASGFAFDAQAYYGGDANKIWFKADGERTGGRWRDVRTEALWDHALSTFWNSQVGVRHDLGEGPNRTWAAFGVQGLAPYWFNIEATAYVGQSGRTAARVEAEYDLYVTQRLILTPDVELNAYGKSDPQRRIGAGLSNAELGLRLRYEVTRQIAPYIGLDFNRRLGKTADYVRADGEAAFDRALVAGVRIWF